MNHPSSSKVSFRYLYGATLFVASAVLGANGCTVEVQPTGGFVACFSSAECGIGSFCSFDLIAACGLSGQPGTCEPEPNSCTQQYTPVCGCDDQTYENECRANAAGVSVVRPGECPGVGDACTATGVPCGLGLFCNFPITAGCGNDPGVCEVIPAMCTQEFLPVCGCDRVTYNNECLARAAGTSVAGPGECGG